MFPRSIVELVAEVEQGRTPKYLFFWGHKQKGVSLDASCLSQWFPSPFCDEGRTFPTAEHYMMFRKAQLFEDREASAKVLSAVDPGKAKSVGRAVRGFDESVWVSHREEIVAAASYLKFSQNPKLGSFLLGTGSRILVEASPVDRIWGIGMAKDQASRMHPSGWKGLNLLGFALMSARARQLAQS